MRHHRSIEEVDAFCRDAERERELPVTGYVPCTHHDAWKEYLDARTDEEVHEDNMAEIRGDSLRGKIANAFIDCVKARGGGRLDAGVVSNMVLASYADVGGGALRSLPKASLHIEDVVFIVWSVCGMAPLKLRASFAHRVMVVLLNHEESRSTAPRINEVPRMNQKKEKAPPRPPPCNGKDVLLYWVEAREKMKFTDGELCPGVRIKCVAPTRSESAKMESDRGDGPPWIVILWKGVRRRACSQSFKRV